MARKIEFNRDAKLHKAMKLFWDKGYEATSMNDLVDELSINRFSIYNSFGDKKALFIEALAFYRKTVLAYLIEPLQGDSPGKEKVLSYLARLEEELLKPGGGLGCMIMRSSFSDIAHDSEIKKCLICMFKDIRTGLLRAVDDARDKGGIQSSESPEVLADYVLCHIQGVIMMRRATGDTSMTVSQMSMLKKEVASW